MPKTAAIVILVLLASTAGYANIVTWGSASLSDNDGGAFLSGFSVVTSGSQFILNLPNFSQSDFAPFSGEVTVAVSADATPDITGVMFKYFGVIDQTNGPASVHYVQTASGSPGSSGDFTTTPFTGLLVRPGSGHINLFAQIDLNDNGGLASINKIEFDLTQASAVPEPSSLIMLAGMLASILGVAWRTRRRVQ